MRQIENLFNKINENYYKPIKTNGAFNDNWNMKAEEIKIEIYRYKNILL